MPFNLRISWEKMACAILAVLVAGCGLAPGGGSAGKVLESGVQRVQDPDVTPGAIEDLAARNTAFALDFYQAVKGGPGNLFFSPYSLSTALAMTYAGARGETEAQMAATLHWDGITQTDLHPAFNALDLRLEGGEAASAEQAQPFELNVANSLWGQQDYPFLPEFLDLLAMNYGAGLRLLDFAEAEAARQAINQWVEAQTQERIKDLIPQGGVDAATRLVLANAIYFKADWLHPFEPNLTHPRPFHRLDGSTVDAPMMSYEHAPDLPYFAGDGFQAVELPYVGQEVSMLLLLPDEGRFDEFEAGLDGGKLQAVLQDLQAVPVDLTLPQFEYSAKFALTGMLSEMGMPAAFCGEATDFSGMDGKGGLCISEVFHKAFVAVDEKGTEAAAASAVVMKESAMIIENAKTVIVDRPFIFLIRHNPTGAVLFAGRVLDPTVK